MGRKYLLVKVKAAGKEPIDSFTAGNAREADEAVKWMRARHAGAEDYSLEPSAGPSQTLDPSQIPDRGESAPAPQAEAGQEDWWVLVCGDPLDPYSLERRDEARERLRTLVAEHGLGLKDHVWVWDSTGTAQVLAAEFPTRECAEERARELRDKGLRVRVRPRMA